MRLLGIVPHPGACVGEEWRVPSGLPERATGGDAIRRAAAAPGRSPIAARGSRDHESDE